MNHTREELHEMVERLPGDRLDEVGSVLARFFSSNVELPETPVRDFGGYEGSFSAETDLAERTEDILRQRFRSENDAA